MDTLSYKTKSFNKEAVEHKWYIIDAENQVLGRMCSKIASILRGKNKPQYTPHSDCGDFVIVINADKIRMTGDKMNSKTYISHTGYPGGQRSIVAKDLMVKKPTRIVEKAIIGMLPKNTLGRNLFRNVFVYAGAEHNHQAQKPETIK